MPTEIKRNTLLKAALLAGLGFPYLVAAREAPRQSISAPSTSDRTALESQINIIANRVANAKPYFDDDPLPVHISASFDPVSTSLIMHADERLGPVSGYSSMEQMQSDVQDEIWPLLKDIPSIRLDWRYGGKDMYFWFPQDRPIDTKTRKRRSPSSASSGSVLISPGHG